MGKVVNFSEVRFIESCPRGEIFLEEMKDFWLIV